jgi:tRNA threonylcarbamoyladenosine biosynthesis protein TsaE
MMSGVHHAIVETPEPTGTGNWLWAEEDQTREFAQRMALQIDLLDSYIELEGDLGAGKTTFVRHLLQALGVKGRIKSPTYAVVEPHEAIDLNSKAMTPVWHFDFYRFNDPEEFEEAGFRDVFAGQGLKIAEWPKQALGMLPLPDLKLKITVNELEGRQVEVAAYSPRGLKILHGMQDSPSTAPKFTTGHANKTP